MSCLGFFLRNIALLFLSLAVSAFVIELALRFSGFEPRVLEANRFFAEDDGTTWSEPDGELGWVNKPGVAISIEHGNAPMTFWDHGRRATRPDSDAESKKRPIMIVGGSNAQSYGVVDRESFPFLLAQRFPELWIENFGNGGYSTAQALLMAERAVPNFYRNARPELIILTFADSHVARNVSDQSWVYSISDSEGRFVSPPHYRLKNGELVFRPFRTIEPWVFETSSAMVTLIHHIWMQSIQFNSGGDGVAVTQRILSRFATFADQVGANFLVVILEDRSQVSAEVFDDAEFPVLDCSGFAREAPADYLLGGTGHPNARLHSHFSMCVASWMASNIDVQENSENP